MPRKTQANIDYEQREKNRVLLQTTPLHILKLLARAQKSQEVTYRIIDGSVDPDDLISPQLRVEFIIQRSGYTDDSIVYAMSEEWQITSVENVLDLIDEEKAEAARKRKIAQEAYDALSEEQREALGLRYRP